MRFALITDMHFGKPTGHEGKLRKMADHAAPLTRGFVERMNTRDQPDLVFNLGDVIEDEDRAADLTNYAEFTEIYSGLKARRLHVAGNHDQVNLTKADLCNLWGHDGELHYSLDIGGFHWTVLRTEHNRAIDVRLPADQIAWLERDLADAQLPTLVLLHHPLCEMDVRGNVWFEKQPHICRVAERRQVRKVLEASGKVIAVFNGHVHWNYVSVLSGIPYVTLQSLTENVEDDAPGTPSGAFAVVDVDRHYLNVEIGGAQPAHYRFETRVNVMGG